MLWLVGALALLAAIVLLSLVLLRADTMSRLVALEAVVVNAALMRLRTRKRRSLSASLVRLTHPGPGHVGRDRNDHRQRPEEDHE